MAPYRGVSRPVITFALERLMDKAARAVRHRSGRDPPPQSDRQVSLQVGDRPDVRRGQLPPDAGDGGRRRIDLPAFRARQKQARAEGRYLGIGFATFSERTGYGSPAFAARGMEITPGWETVEITMDPSGLVEARIGASPHGQGLRTTLAQIIADELGVDARHRSGSSMATPTARPMAGAPSPAARW